jgi:hypothetical protein
LSAALVSRALDDPPATPIEDDQQAHDVLASSSYWALSLKAMSFWKSGNSIATVLP